jgi:hypothetical protein
MRTNDTEYRIELTQRLHFFREELNAGRLHLGDYGADIHRDLAAAQYGSDGLVIADSLTPSLRAVLLAVRYFRDTVTGSDQEDDAPLEQLAMVQREYFHNLGDVFRALVGTRAEDVHDFEEIRSSLLSRANSDYADLADSANQALGGLSEFYKRNGRRIFTAAKSLGGIKLVLGGASHFGKAEEASVRKMLLYCDTVLLPDPIYPFFEANRPEAAIHLQIAQRAYWLLQLKPLVEEELAIPPLFVFPSFEKALEDCDVTTQYGIQSLVLAVVNACCGTVRC